MTTYRIVRFFRDDRDTETIVRGLTLEQARAHCQREDSRGEDFTGCAWFDAYTSEDE
jgi:hypothetical protein